MPSACQTGVSAGLVRNPKSRLNRKASDDFSKAARDRLGPLYAETDTPEQLRAALESFAEKSVDLLIVDGGDGTLHQVLTAFPPAWAARPPRIAIMASGNTNLVAADVGSGVRGIDGLSKLLDFSASGNMDASHIRSRYCLEIHRGGETQILRGMFMGAAAFTRASELTHRKIHPGGLFHTPAVLFAIAVSLAQSLRKKSRHEWLSGDPMKITPDDLVESEEHNRFIFLATSLHRMLFGIWPFWNENSSPLRYLDVAAHPQRFGAACLSMLRGRIPLWMKNAEDYRSGGAASIDIKLSRPFMLDGETYEPGAEGHMLVKAGPKLEFIVP